MIKSYCNNDVERGIFLLKLASSRGCVRSSYALGLILRDSLPEEATRHMKRAASQGYLPALQETLPAREMKVKYGEPDAAALRCHLDPYCLNRLLGRHYLHCTQLRDVNTSHCWNPLCGRWAYKATPVTGHGPHVVRRPFAFAFYRHPVETTGVAVPSRHNLESANSGARTVHLHEGHRHAARNENVSQNGSDHDSARTVGQTARAAAGGSMDVRVSRMKMCSRCCRAKYCSKLCQVYDWRSGRHKMECQFL